MHYQQARRNGDFGPAGVCSVSECSDIEVCRGLCNKHYTRWRHHGDPTHEEPTADERFWAQVRQTAGCWEWTGRMDKNGYGVFWWDAHQGSAHVYSYEQAFGSVPLGLVLDHLCHTHDLTCHAGSQCPHRRCVNPWHLEAVTNSENVKRGRGSPEGWFTARTHCKHGHPFNEENTGYRPGGRDCKTCRRIVRKRRDQRKAKERREGAPSATCRAEPS
jgi:hypothetical protein